MQRQLSPETLGPPLTSSDFFHRSHIHIGTPIFRPRDNLQFVHDHRFISWIKTGKRTLYAVLSIIDITKVLLHDILLPRAAYNRSICDYKIGDMASVREQRPMVDEAQRFILRSMHPNFRLCRFSHFAKFLGFFPFFVFIHLFDIIFHVACRGPDDLDEIPDFQEAPEIPRDDPGGRTDRE